MAGKAGEKRCTDCSAYNQCRDTATSWLFLFVGLIATISIRLVNLVLHLDPLWPKLFWYVGVGGFCIYFLYKFRQDKIMQKSLVSGGISGKISGRENLEEADYEFLDGLLCRLKSKKDSINYFFIFFTSVLVLIVAIYQDFFRR